MINKQLLKEISAQMGINLNDEALERYDIYAEMLVETNKAMNLTAITEPEEIVYKHFADSLSLFNAIDFKQGSKVIDVGTGAGFPGVVLLIARPDLKMTLIDGTNKRLGFISDVLEKIGLSAKIVHIRAELAGKDPDFREKFDIATARAVAELNTLSEYCLPFVKKGGVFAPMKASRTEEEIQSAKSAIKILGGQIKTVKELDMEKCGERCIIVIEKISQTPPKYPRASAQINKKPLV